MEKIKFTGVTEVKELWSYVSVGAGMALASSCFAAMAHTFALVPGRAMSLSILLAGLIVVLISFCFAELCSRFPSSPGIGFYLRKAYGESPSLFFLILYLGLICFLTGIECFVFSQLLVFVFPILGSDLGLILAHGILVLVLLANLKGIELSRSLQDLTTLILIGGIFCLGLGALMGPSPIIPLEPLAPLSESVVTKTGIMEACGMAVFLFIGLEWVIPLGRTPQSYRHQVPLSMPVATVILCLMYGVFSLALAKHIPHHELINSSYPQLLLANKLLPFWGGPIAVFLSFLAIFTSFNAGIMGGAKLIYAMGREKFLPSWIVKISPQGIPVGAITFLGFIGLFASIVINTWKFYRLSTAMGAAIECLIYGVTLMAFYKIKKGPQPKTAQYFKTPFPAWVAIPLALISFILGIGALESAGNSQGFATFTCLSLIAAVLTKYCYNRKRKLSAPKEVGKLWKLEL